MYVLLVYSNILDDYVVFRVDIFSVAVACRTST